ncbi:MAG: ribbon-helix-helix protein, CopG family [Chloroflexi bacterium]|nr:ribbon-helix-helix protein, CopG family [Chloroflexota bacterium]
MRTTIDLDEDIQAAVERLRRQEGLGLSEAVNQLARAGLTREAPRGRRFVQRTARLGLRLDVTSVQDALEQLDGPGAR